LCPRRVGGVIDHVDQAPLAAEHLAAEDGLQVDGETLRRWMLAEGYGFQQLRGNDGIDRQTVLTWREYLSALLCAEPLVDFVGVLERRKPHQFDSLRAIAEEVDADDPIQGG
jgi:hypothetical protein